MGAAAVYNRFWTTGGGAEKYAGAVAEHLSRRGPVVLLAHEPFDPASLGERLSLDLSGCSVQVVPLSARAVTAASADRELFVNVSHRSRDVPAARRSLYVVHFPTDPADPADPAAPVAWGTGVHLPDGATTWTDGQATLLVTTAPHEPAELRLHLGFQRPPAAGPTEVRVLVDGQERASTRLGPPRSPVERLLGRALSVQVASPAPGVPVEVTVCSDAFVPADLGGGADRRVLGVPVLGVALGPGRLQRLRPAARPVPLSGRWLAGYDAVVSNSAFTADWVERRWQVGSTVLHPPVTLRTPGRKDRVVLAVGRFFPPGEGHSKRQRELVQAFQALVDGGVRDWELHLVGGCAAGGEAYLAEVRAQAQGLPVVIHVDASGRELEELTSRASLFWHLAGLGEDEQAHPERLEHFGISTVEAMSAGAVPVVLGSGGLRETVRDGVDGCHVGGVEELAAVTRGLVADPARLAALSAAAQQRASEFSVAEFGRRLDQLLASLG